MSLTITSDHNHAAAVLQKIAQICAAHGAHWNPEVSAEIRGGTMRILAPPGTTGPLISMPTALLVPIAEAQWRDESNALLLKQPPPQATAVQHELLELHAELYNATNKMP